MIRKNQKVFTLKERQIILVNTIEHLKHDVWEEYSRLDLMYHTAANYNMPFHLARAVVLGANFILELEKQELIHNTAPLIDPYTITFYPLYKMELRRLRRYPLSDFTTPYSILALTSIIKLRVYTDDLTVIPEQLGAYILNNPLLLAHRCLSKNDRNQFLVRGVTKAISGYWKYVKRKTEFPEYIRDDINFMLSYQEETQ